MEAAPAIDTSPAPPPSGAPAPDPGNVISSPPDAPIVDAPRGSEITPRDAEVPVDLDHPADAQPDLREVFPQQPAPEQREQPQPQQPQEPQPQEPAIAMPDVFDANEADAWNTLPRQTQEILTHVVEHTKAKLAPQLEQATQMSAANLETLTGAALVVSERVRSHNDKVTALMNAAQNNPQAVDQFLRTPDGERLLSELAQSRDAANQDIDGLRRVGAQAIQLNQAHQDQQTVQQRAALIEQWDEAAHDVVDGGVTEEKQDRFNRYYEAIGGNLDELADTVKKNPVLEMWLHHPLMQRVVDDAAAAWEAQARQAAARALAQQRERERSRAIPPPMRPGVGGGAGPPSATLARAAAEGDMGTYINLRNRGAVR
jgi:hypothetical protein